MAKEIKKVLIFRHGSLGDTVVALPCFHLIARAFPHAERRLLTTISPDENTVPLSAVLDPTGLVHGYLTYPIGNRGMTGHAPAISLLKLRQQIREWQPDALIYLAEPRSSFSAWRDALFFKLCGIKNLIGVPYTKELRENRWLPERKCFEHESERLVRCLAVLGEIRLGDPESWDLRLTPEEEASASRYLDAWKGKKHFIICHLLAKVKQKDWGRENWRELFSRLGQTHSDWGLVMVGGRAGAGYSEDVVQAWRGPRLNLSGQLTLRESVAVVKRASFYLGHDSGPMHLAAALGIPSVAVFVDCKKPGVWFPHGNFHKVIYPPENGKVPHPVTVDEVFNAVCEMIR